FDPFVTGGLTLAATGIWRFATFANDVLVTNGVDPVLVSANGTTPFAVLAGSPPKGKLVATVDPGGTGAFAFVADTSASGGDATFWACSKQGDDTVWSLSIADNSTSGFLQSTPGPITALVPLGTNMVAFKKTSIYVGQFTGPPFVWSFQVQDNNYGVLN